ncbi:MAG: BlaI/MecI/CopY family transcriptional regulator [Gammaproteobacteria bacterium]|nr:BlaI/MecI/CopY family transcriptional regulator [Gammaproteobacteria bacterium]
MTKPIDLSDFELEVMQLFWQYPESTAPEIHKLIEQLRPVSYSTIKTIIDRLEKKQAISRSRQQGRTIYYFPLIEKNQLRKPMIKDFIKRVFLGESKPLVAHILKEEALSLDDISYLELLLEQKKKELK